MENDQVRFFGNLADGTPIKLIQIASGEASAEILTYGARIRSFIVPDMNKRPVDVVLGYNDMRGYEQDINFMGAVIGRVSNVIKGGKITVDGQEYKLTGVHGDDHFNGGRIGLHRKVWEVLEVTSSSVTLMVTSPDGDEGYPGMIKIKVTYYISGRDLTVDYEAVSNKDTLCSLSSCLIFNVDGNNAGSILKQRLQINARNYLPIDKNIVPTGEIASVAGTPLDYRASRRIGNHINDDHEQLKPQGGYSHAYIIDGEPGKMRQAAVVNSDDSEMTLEVYTSDPVVTFYTGSFLNGSFGGKEGATYQPKQGMMLAPSKYPDAPNHEFFPGIELKAGEIYSSRTSYRVYSAFDNNLRVGTMPEFW